MKYLITVGLILTALSERVFFDLGPNVELITLVMLLAAVYLGAKYSVIAVLAVMVISDLIIGNTSIFLFTWTGFLIPALATSLLFHKSSWLSNVIKGTTTGIFSNVFFYLWTNFGVWLLSSMYPNTAGGLLLSYINGLPFLKLQLLSTLLFVPLGFLITELVINTFKTTVFPSAIRNLARYSTVPGRNTG